MRLPTTRLALAAAAATALVLGAATAVALAGDSDRTVPLPEFAPGVPNATFAMTDAPVDAGPLISLDELAAGLPAVTTARPAVRATLPPPAPTTTTVTEPPPPTSGDAHELRRDRDAGQDRDRERDRERDRDQEHDQDRDDEDDAGRVVGPTTAPAAGPATNAGPTDRAARVAACPADQPGCTPS